MGNIMLLTEVLTRMGGHVANQLSFPVPLCARAGLFNPQSFLTAVMQTTARKNDWPLDKTVIVTEVTKKSPEQVEGPSRDGAFVHGLSLEGARWDEKIGALAESKHKELSSKLPVNTPP